MWGSDTQRRCPRHWQRIEAQLLWDTQHRSASHGTFECGLCSVMCLFVRHLTPQAPCPAHNRFFLYTLFFFKYIFFLVGLLTILVITFLRFEIWQIYIAPRLHIWRAYLSVAYALWYYFWNIIASLWQHQFSIFAFFMSSLSHYSSAAWRSLQQFKLPVWWVKYICKFK